ncbi:MULTISPECIES: glutamate-5-semialdehyde dehydrogenase [unclassified Paenibacillus]|uniref:glutamate-5-semialdehyde dehydrogenase n=1 Tax=unclassified Paenibacillus TaxID=185978 RepID=UPI0024068507|nr:MULTISPECIES: glutamate-5-semialdehyde dehydrogenase [unclassified Paenibacillus]MDF9840269.1 glutamate-5-semialdehyde dehydrogenase [Paenibacillus sp. PastF-2]MDF9846851.1 glutamate-5-semialdehyde dehydrogenase [Paenibacillus sp. PastM-2]MDF9853423.1 glutamate-5-semialdehyde dehydrogenase [Paenibacillus sp. PastF-1]MDH6479090.1 glutamate-5-semialdehyde dehydrogenase [Paenibacillus sp. PastH-2]MDH6506821.1 glutamate-5-semialdehyde dehydrogenase [Paenibacillus sp. PastM-3]
MSEVINKATLAKETTGVLASLTTGQKNEALLIMADALRQEAPSIIAANAEDLERGRKAGTPESMLDRLALDVSRIGAIAEGLQQIAVLPDPVGDTLEQFERPNGLSIEKIRVPLGVIGIIYEARPNVTVDAAGLCLKTGNAVVLRGGSSALSSNRKIVEVLHTALAKTSIPAAALQLIEDPNRSSVDEMLKLNGLLDVIIPRGGSSLIQNVVMNATVPVIETGAGICHTYLDAGCQPEMAERISVNAKAQRPSVCNSMETLLVNREYAARHLPALAEAFRKVNVELRGCPETVALIPWAVPVTAEDYATEYNDYILNVRIVGGLDEALRHIAEYSTKHSECIVTENAGHAARFLQEVDAAAVYHNASTRFTDGFEFGFGAEIGISTQKLHARGPMGLPALTSCKYIIRGTGQIRG